MAQTDLPKFLRDPKYAAILKKAVEVEEHLDKDQYPRRSWLGVARGSSLSGQPGEARCGWNFARHPQVKPEHQLKEVKRRSLLSFRGSAETGLVGGAR
jgi:hypothetical protein